MNRGLCLNVAPCVRSRTLCRELVRPADVFEVPVRLRASDANQMIWADLHHGNDALPDPPTHGLNVDPIMVRNLAASQEIVTAGSLVRQGDRPLLSYIAYVLAGGC